MKKSRKLALRVETLRVLVKLEIVAGGMTKMTWIGPGENACSYTNHDQRTPCATIDNCPTRNDRCTVQ